MSTRWVPDNTRLPSTGVPKFVMVGIDRPGGGVRVYASRDIAENELRWGLATNDYGTGTGWHVDAEMRKTLIVDGQTWGEAFEQIFRIWANHDRNAVIEGAQHRQQLEAGLFHFGDDNARHKGGQDGCPLCHPAEPRKPVTGRVLDGPAHGQDTSNPVQIERTDLR